MGPCSSIDKDVFNACDNSDLKRLQQIFNSEDGADFDVFRSIHLVKDAYKDIPAVNYDCLALVIYFRRGAADSLIPFFELIKKQIEKNRSAKKDSKPNFASLQTSHIELLVEQGGATTDEFNFLIDNSDIIPLQDSSDKSCYTLLHLLCDSRDRIDLLKEYLSSGRIDERFKNSDNDGEKMRHPTKYDNRTPLQVACAAMNVEAVQELAVNNLGGVNYTESIEEALLVSTTDADREEQIVTDICLCLLSQPNADSIRDHVVQNETLKKVLFSERPTERSKLLEIYLPPNENDEIQLATAAYILGMDKLHSCLLTNGCQPQKKKLACAGLCSSSTDNLRSILVELRAQDVCIDINRGGDHGGAVYYAATSCDIDNLKLLIDAGCDVNQEGFRGVSPLEACMSGGRFSNITTEDRDATMEVLINAGADINHDNGGPLQCVLSNHYRTTGVSVDKFFELTKDKNLNVKDVRFSHGRTALHQAISLGSVAGVKHLLPLSDLTVKNDDGDTPKQYAARQHGFHPKEINNMFVNY